MKGENGRCRGFVPYGAALAAALETLRHFVCSLTPVPPYEHISTKIYEGPSVNVFIAYSENRDSAPSGCQDV